MQKTCHICQKIFNCSGFCGRAIEGVCYCPDCYKKTWHYTADTFEKCFGYTAKVESTRVVEKAVAQAGAPKVSIEELERLREELLG